MLCYILDIHRSTFHRISKMHHVLSPFVLRSPDYSHLPDQGQLDHVETEPPGTGMTDTHQTHRLFFIFFLAVLRLMCWSSFVYLSKLSRRTQTGWDSTWYQRLCVRNTSMESRVERRGPLFPEGFLIWPEVASRNVFLAALEKDHWSAQETSWP